MLATKTEAEILQRYYFRSKDEFTLFLDASIVFFLNGPTLLVRGNCPVTFGGELDSTWVAKLRVHAEGQITS